MAEISREQKDITVGENTYLITAFPALYGVDIFNQCVAVNFALNELSPKLIKDVVVRSVSINNVQLDDKKFDIHFSKKYKVLFTLFSEIIAFNFEDMQDESSGEETESPNE